MRRDRRSCPPLRRFAENGVHFHLRHIPWSSAELREAPMPSIHLHGHTHRPEIRPVETGYLLCPGAVRLPRGGFPPSYAWIVLEEGRCRFTLRAIPGREKIAEELWTIRRTPQLMSIFVHSEQGKFVL